MTKDPKNQQRSIMLAANVGSYSKSAVGLAVQMAASMNAELRGLFIEDEDLFVVRLFRILCQRKNTRSIRSQIECSIKPAFKEDGQLR